LDSSEFGHTKGVLAFDIKTDTAFWLLHSWPCFPSITPVDDPAPNFGQTFLCVTLKDVLTADAIAAVFHVQQQPQIIGMSLPAGIDPAKYPHLVRLAKDMPPAPVPLGSATPSDTTFTSKAGATFRLFAKSKDWIDPAADKVQPPKDLYSDLIGPALHVNLEVETWQDGEPDEDSDRIHTTADIQWVDLSALGLDYSWNFLMNDHAKWAVSRDLSKLHKTDWVIVADINRIDTQFKRGGGAIAFENQALAASLHSIIKMVPPAADEAVIAANQAKATAARKATAAKKAAATAGKATVRKPNSPRPAPVKRASPMKKAARKARKTRLKKRAAVRGARRKAIKKGRGR
jgi:deoxyribonuclease-2